MKASIFLMLIFSVIYAAYAFKVAQNGESEPSASSPYEKKVSEPPAEGPPPVAAPDESQPGGTDTSEPTGEESPPLNESSEGGE